MGLFVSILILFSTGGLVLAICWVAGIWPFTRSEPTGLHTARFATDKEIRHLLSRVSPLVSLLLCRNQHKQLVAVQSTPEKRELGNLLVVGPTRCGKGLLATSQLLSWSGSVIVNDIKGELFSQTAGYRSRLGKVIVIDPTGVGKRFDPLSCRTTEADMYAAAAELLHDPQERDKIFTLRATTMLACMLSAAHLTGVPAFVCLRWFVRSGLQETAERLHSVKPELATMFLDTTIDKAYFQDRFLISSWGTLCARLQLLLPETIVRSLSGSDFSPAELMLGKEPVSIYLRLSERDLLSLAPLVRLMWGSLIGELITTYDRRRGNGCSPVLLLIDEAGRTAIPSLVEHATTVVGRGINLWVAIQSLSQLSEKYGREGGQVIRDNMESQVFYRPIDLGSADYLEHRLGTVSGFAQSETLRDGQQTTEGRSEQAVPLLSAQQIMQLPDSDVLAFHRGLPPLRGTRVDWRDMPELVDRHNLPPPMVIPLPPLPEQLFDGSDTDGDDNEYIA